VASYQSAWAPVQPEAPQRSTGMAPTAVLGLAAMAAVGATGAIGLATPARAATINDVMGSAARGSLSVQDHVLTEMPAGATAMSTRTADPATALVERIRAQALRQRAGAEDAARRQAAEAAAAKAQAAAAQVAAQTAAQPAVQAVQPVQAVQAARPQLGDLVSPVTGAAVGAGFGQAGSYWSHLHTGLDLEAATGAPVVAIGKGEITSAGWAGAYGYRVVETLPDGTELWYCHLSAIGVGAGEVTAGQPIGRVGATGNVTGPHLHLEVRPGGGEPVDPANWLAENGLRIN
jgi:murein DD-endopeptidase MepM/ murein hydrolase activator NlpD